MRKSIDMPLESAKQCIFAVDRQQISSPQPWFRTFSGSFSMLPPIFIHFYREITSFPTVKISWHNQFPLQPTPHIPDTQVVTRPLNCPLPQRSTGGSCSTGSPGRGHCLTPRSKAVPWTTAEKRNHFFGLRVQDKLQYLYSINLKF